jgi:hypothetical protein
VSGCPRVRRATPAPALLALLIALVATACNVRGQTAEPLATQAPKETADAFVAELLDGRPEDAAERLSSSHAGFEFELPQISIELQINDYRVVRSKRRSNRAFVYHLRGRRDGQPVSSFWVVYFERDTDAWRIANFSRSRRF